MEIWKDVAGYEGIYQVSNFGNVKNISTNKIITRVKHHRGYIVVCLSKNGKHKNHSVHRLVAIAFIPNQYNYEQINHKDEDKQNNNVENLEWCSQKYNNNYGTRNTRAKSAIRKKIIQYSISGEMIREWESVTDASNCLNICKGSISQCCNGKYRTAGGFVWEQKEKAQKRFTVV